MGWTCLEGKVPVGLLLLALLAAPQPAGASVNRTAEEPPAAAEEAPPILPRIGAFFGLCAMPFYQLRDDVAVQQEISSGGSAGSLYFGAHLGGFFLVGMELGLGEPYRDDGEFTESTNLGPATSRVDYYLYSLFFGPSTPPLLVGKNKKMGFTVYGQFGGTWVFGEKRHVEDCIGCSTEKLDIVGGLFVEPNVEIYYVLRHDGEQFGRVIKLGIGFAYRRYVVGDPTQAAIIKLFIGGQ